MLLGRRERHVSNEKCGVSNGKVTEVISGTMSRPDGQADSFMKWVVRSRGEKAEHGYRLCRNLKSREGVWASLDRLDF